MATKLDIFIKVSDAQQARIAWQPLDASGNSAGDKSAYTNALAEPSGSGYQWRYSIMNMPVKVRLFILPYNNTGGEVQLIVDRPASDKARATVYPLATMAGSYANQGDLVNYLSN